MDINALHDAIRIALPLDSKSVAGMELAKDPTKPHWELGADGLLCLDN